MHFQFCSSKPFQSSVPSPITLHFYCFPYFPPFPFLFPHTPPVSSFLHIPDTYLHHTPTSSFSRHPNPHNSRFSSLPPFPFLNTIMYFFFPIDSLLRPLHIFHFLLLPKEFQSWFMFPYFLLYTSTVSSLLCVPNYPLYLHLAFTRYRKYDLFLAYIHLFFPAK